MAQLPLVEVDQSGLRDWLQPDDIHEAFRLQARFIRPDLSSLRWTVLFTVLPGTIFMRWLFTKTRPPEALCNTASFDLCLLWAIAALFSLLAASCRNPGVVPRASAGKGTAVVHLPQRCIVVNGVAVKQRWCHTCRLYRPLRSKHCSQCDRCVFRFDHHCTWLGNCVGLGNYRSFLGLVVASAVFFGHSATLTILVLRRKMRQDAQDEESCSHSFIQHGWEVLYFLYALVMFLALLVLVLYHGIIIGCNLTTNEHVRDYYLARNPFDRSCTDNCLQVLCAPYGRELKVDREAILGEPACSLGQTVSRVDGDLIGIAAHQQDLRDAA